MRLSPAWQVIRAFPTIISYESYSGAARSMKMGNTASP
jgi:hypothetical protein